MTVGTGAHTESMTGGLNSVSRSSEEQGKSGEALLQLRVGWPGNPQAKSGPVQGHRAKQQCVQEPAVSAARVLENSELAPAQEGPSGAGLPKPPTHNRAP